MNKLSIPDDFLWGASMSAHQVEGGNNNDWSEWEKKNAERLAAEANASQDCGNGKGTLPNWDMISKEAKDPTNYISGSAVDGWERWKGDIDLAKSLGMNALRYSVEWSRVEPSPQTFDQSAIDHYADVTNYCIDNDIHPVVTLHHFTNPNWVADKGSWENKDVVSLFTDYVKRISTELPTENVHWNIINEANAYAGFGWVLGQWPPGKHNPAQYLKVARNLIEAHKRSYDVLKEENESTQVSSAVNYIHFEAKNTKLHEINRAVAWLGRTLVNEWFQKATMDHQDYIALNHYMHCVVNGGLFKNDPNEPRSDLGWYLNPDSMLAVLKEAGVYKKPIIITENGVADAEDKHREWYLSESLSAMQQAVDKGIDVKGYLHWSLLDNFEWDKGYWPKLGLVSVDRQTMQRTPRPSALAYKNIIESGSIA